MRGWLNFRNERKKRWKPLFQRQPHCRQEVFPKTQTLSSLEFSFAEPALESTSSDTSNFATMNMDGNATIPSKACEKSALPPKLNKEVQCLPQGVCDAQIQTDKLVISNREREWFDSTDWFKANKHKVKPGIRQHAHIVWKCELSPTSYLYLGGYFLRPIRFFNIGSRPIRASPRLDNVQFQSNRQDNQ